MSASSTSQAMVIPAFMVISTKGFLHLCSSINCVVCIAHSSNPYINMGWFSPFQEDVAVSEFEGCECYLDVFPPFFFSFMWSYLIGVCVTIAFLPNILRVNRIVDRSKFIILMIFNVHLVVRDILFVAVAMYCVQLVLHLILIVVLYIIILSLYFMPVMPIMYMYIYMVFFLFLATAWSFLCM